MSHISFSSPDMTKFILPSSERFYAKILIDNLTLSFLYSTFENDKRKILDAISGQDYFINKNHKDLTWYIFKCWWAQCDNCVRIGDKIVRTGILSANTALIMSDSINLLSRIHNQCEIHLFTEDRKFFGDIVKQGLRDKIYRKNRGWEDLLKYLDKSNGPLVMNYSVCGLFPYSLCNDYEEKEYSAIWNEAYNNLKENSKIEYLEFDKESFREIRFGGGLTIFDLLEQFDE